MKRATTEHGVTIQNITVQTNESCLSLPDEYWSQHPELHDIPIYYASSLAKKCMAVYQTYVNAMNDKIRRQIAINNPFVFRHISNLKVQ
jgi:cleavage and polyadenylation specificity factor subunit 3